MPAIQKNLQGERCGAPPLKWNPSCVSVELSADKREKNMATSASLHAINTIHAI